MNHNEEGLNLCYETIWGIINHSSTFAKKCEFKYEIKKDEYVCKLRGNDEKCNVQGLSLGFYEIYKKFDKLDYFTIEAICVSLADEIAQRHHDIEDGLYTKIIRKEEILEEISSLVKEDDLQREKIEQFLKSENTAFMSELSSFIINYYVHTVCNYLISYFSKFKKCDNLKELRESINDINLLIEEIDLSRIIKYDRQFQQFLMQRILYSHKAQLMDGKAYFIIKRLYKAYLTNPHQLPDATIIKIIRNYFLFYIKQEKFDKFFRIIKEIKTPLINNFFEKYSITELKHVSKLFEQGISREFLNVMLKERTHTFCSILLRTITDHIAGMTDKKAMEEYRNLYAIK
jgi:dGTPase